METFKNPNIQYESSTDDDRQPILDDIPHYLTIEGSVDIQKPGEPQKREFHVLLATMFAAIGSLCLGYCLGYSSPALRDFNLKDSDVHLDKNQGSLFASLVTLGALIGCPAGGVIIDLLGRKSTIMISAIPYEVGWLLIAYAQENQMLYAGRFITGIGCGLIAVSFPVYVAEISSSESRGALGAVHQLSITFGILLSYVVGVFFGWRIMALGGAIMPVVLVILMFFMTETPRWYLVQNNRGAALDSLRWLRGHQADVEEECFELERNMDRHKKMSCRECCRPSITRPLLIGVSLMIFQQLCGAIAIVMNCADIFASAGFKYSKILSISIAFTQLVANIVACSIIDRIGRRILLLSMAVVMCLSHAGLGTFFQLSTNLSTGVNATVHSGTSHAIQANDLSWIAITCLVVFYIAFSLAWGPVPWIIISEVFPLRARGIAGSIATIAAFGGAFFVTWLFVYMQDAFTVPGVYWFYSGCCLLSFFFVFAFVPETKGRSLEEIETFFEPPRTMYSEIE